VAARQEINSRLDGFISRGRADGTIAAPVNATDVIAFSALLTQPLSHGPDWERMAARQIAIFLNGIAGSGPAGHARAASHPGGHRGRLRESPYLAVAASSLRGAKAAQPCGIAGTDPGAGGRTRPGLRRCR
jgi:hypothetical protein